jgi:hypothetical protein
MESMSTINSVISNVHNKAPRETPVPTTEIVPQETQSNTLYNKYLQPDQVEISEASRKKLSESEEKDPQELADTSDKVMTKEEVDATSKTNESDIDKQIRELSMEILDISIQIQMLEGKENKESVEERQALEVELAMKKGLLEATIGRKLQMATLAS